MVAVNVEQVRCLKLQGMSEKKLADLVLPLRFTCCFPWEYGGLGLLAMPKYTGLWPEAPSGSTVCACRIVNSRKLTLHTSTYQSIGTLRWNLTLLDNFYMAAHCPTKMGWYWLILLPYFRG